MGHTGSYIFRRLLSELHFVYFSFPDLLAVRFCNKIYMSELNLKICTSTSVVYLKNIDEQDSERVRILVIFKICTIVDNLSHPLNWLCDREGAADKSGTLQ